MSSIIDRGRPAEILLAEDNDNDVELTRMSFRKSKLAINLHVVRDGEECMAFLRKQDGYRDVPAPDLLLLDLNMPKMDGREVLAEIAADPVLHYLPVVILTTSDQEQEILEMYNLRCSSYIVKPVNFEQFSRVIQLITEYWFTVVVLPSSPRTGNTS